MGTAIWQSTTGATTTLNSFTFAASHSRSMSARGRSRRDPAKMCSGRRCRSRRCRGISDAGGQYERGLFQCRRAGRLFVECRPVPRRKRPRILSGTAGVHVRSRRSRPADRVRDGADRPACGDDCVLGHRQPMAFRPRHARDRGKFDFYTVAVHELLHALGFGAAAVSWNANHSGANWTGASAASMPSAASASSTRRTTTTSCKAR